MTEVPEHLLRRSRERREALGLATGGAPAQTASAEAPSAEPAPAPEPAGAPPAAAAGPPTETAPAPVLEEATVPAAAAVGVRNRIPAWVMPVLVVLPFWGVLYMGAFGERAVKKALSPREVYAKGGCTSCHGSNGEGGTGPALAGGASALTFPNEEDHISWVKTGSGPFTGRSYGDPNRPGGPRPPATGGMPGFEGQLSEAEIRAVVKLEREEL